MICEKYGRVEQATDENTAHALCIMDNYGYKHTTRICNTYWSSTATMFNQTRIHINPYPANVGNIVSS